MTDETKPTMRQRLNKYTPKDIAKRSLATFIAAIASSPIAVALGLDWLEAVALAGGTAVVNMLGRLGLSWLAENPE